MWLGVLKKIYEAEQSEASAVIDTFLQKSVGVADHDNFVKTLKTNFDTMETNIKGVFAAGDIVRGASLVVWAIKDGRDAATAMKNYLEDIELKKTKVA